MSTARAVIHAGICGFVTEVTATSDDDQHVQFYVTSPCDNIQGLARQLPAVDAYAELGAGYAGLIHQTAQLTLKGCCSGCIVPNGIFKAMQVAAIVALPKLASIEIEKVDSQR